MQVSVSINDQMRDFQKKYKCDVDTAAEIVLHWDSPSQALNSSILSWEQYDYFETC